MKKIGICGSFGGKKGSLDGQTVKTKIITEELEYIYGENKILKIDTFGGVKRIFYVLFKLFGFLFKCDNVMVLPAHNSLRLVAPFLYYAKKISKCKTHYIVIGGWLPEFLVQKKWLKKYISAFDNVLVETNGMKEKLQKIISANISVMPNCKHLNILTEDELIFDFAEPYSLCTFSRVSKQKGIEDAVRAVTNINKKLGRTAYTLDIYGQIDSDQTEWFENLKNKFPEYIKYCGTVPFNKSVETLKDYFALLFPTYYSGEGFPGTIIDALAAGVPVIASNWKYNGEIVSDDVGFIFNSKQEFEKILYDATFDISKINGMRKACIKKSENYNAKRVVQEFAKEYI